MPALYIVLEKKIPNLDPMVNGNWLSKESVTLEKLAKKLKVIPLMDFFSASPDEVAFLMENMEEGSTDISNRNTQEQWFAAEDGLKTISALLENVEMIKLSSASHVRDDLRDFERVLEAAHTAKVKWHLAVDY
jgi:hypothetical protein